MDTNKLLEFFQKAQEWIDQQSTSHIPQDFSGKSRLEILEEQIIELLKKEMVEKKFQTRDQQIHIPTHYFVTISEEMNELLRGKPRQLLLQDLNGFVRQQIRLLRMETLEKEFIQIQVSESSEIKVSSESDQEFVPDIRVQTIENSGDFSNAKTIVNPNFNFGNDDETLVIPRRFYSLEICFNSHSSLIPVYQKSITIGRSSEQNIRLEAPEVSRRMAVLSCETEDTFRLVNYGINPIIFKDEMLMTNQTLTFGFEDNFQIAGYLMAVKK
jgi:hypothetical protein